MNQSNTTASRLTPRGRGAVASILVEGQLEILDQFFQATSGKPISEQTPNRIYYGLWGTSHKEDVVGIKTADNEFEIHCHGGAVAVDRILNDLRSVSLTIKQTAQDLSHDDSLRSEFQECLQRATTLSTAHHVLRQSRIFPAALKEILSSSPDESSREASKILEWARFGCHLITPWQVVLCGSPNVGKSSLINALVGFSRSVVFDQPGTTRDVVTVQTALDGWPIEFSDTAGIRDADESLESQGIEKALSKIQLADLLIVVADARIGVTQFEEQILQSHDNAMVVINKIDLLNDQSKSQNHFAVSATAKLGVEKLSTEIVKRLIPDLPDKHQPFPITDRQAEILQECIQ